MNNERWFSAKLRFALMVESIGGRTLNDCVYLLKATDFDVAFERALAIGYASQREYPNAAGQLVQWRFMEIYSLDLIQDEDLDGHEVYSEPIHLGEEKMIPFETEFNPRASKPIQTI